MNLKKQPYIILLSAFIIIASATGFKKSAPLAGLSVLNIAKPDSAVKPLNLTPSASPIDLGSIDAKFYKDLSYGNSKENLFDIFLPQSGKVSSLLVFIHGGGFINGNKSIPYEKGSSPDLIRTMLSNNIAFATLDYTLLTPDNKQGVLQCMNDCKRALQYIRYYAKKLNINKDKVVLMGGSAGAGTSLWIAFNNDMADKKSPDPVLRESTRVKGVVAASTQSTYNLFKWSDVVFKEYQDKGFNRQSVENIITKKRMLNFYGMDDNGDLNSPACKAYCAKVDMLDLMSSDDPEILVENSTIKYQLPTQAGELNHHPLHAKALIDEAARKHLKGEFYIPQMNIDTRNGETREAFIIRLIGGK